MKIARFGLTALLAGTFFFGFAAFSSAAGDHPEKPGDKSAVWSQFNAFILNVTPPDASGYYSKWNGQFDTASHDVRIESETSEGGPTKRGKVLLIGGRVLALQGNLATPGYEIDALDGPVLQYQLLVRMLSAVLPDGPSDMRGARAIEFAEDKHSIEIGTDSAGGSIAPPWHVKGTVKVAGPDVIEYELALTSAVKEKPASPDKRRLNFSGRLSKVASARLNDSMALDGWRLFWIGPYVKKVGGGTIYDYGASPAPELHKTVGAVRVDIRNRDAADNYQGERDASKDFTGFWKSKCDNPFGLQIMHYGSDGEYLVAFCGPGGCMDQDHARKSFITGDKHYEVVSDYEFVQIGRDGSHTTYHRCTRDTHPVLKYQK